MSTAGIYKIPRKRKMCIISYDNKLFQTRDDIVAYLENLGFTPAAADFVLQTLRTLTLEEITAEFKAHRVSKANQELYLKGEVVKKKTTTRKKKTA